MEKPEAKAKEVQEIGSMRIATWNIRDLGGEGKKNTVKNLIKEEIIDLIGLVETKYFDVSQ